MLSVSCEQRSLAATFLMPVRFHTSIIFSMKEAPGPMAAHILPGRIQTVRKSPLSHHGENSFNDKTIKKRKGSIRIKKRKIHTLKNKRKYLKFPQKKQ